MNRFRKCFVIIFFMGIASMLSGCTANGTFSNAMQNVEQRDYATVLLISSGKDGKRYNVSLGIAKEKKVGEKSQTEEVSSFAVNDFEELKEEYQSVKGKTLSLTHLKVILLSFENMNVMMELQEILYALDENQEIAKTCPVLQIEEKKHFLSYMKQADVPVGTYVSNLIGMKEREGEEVPWLKDYLKVIREGGIVQTYYLVQSKEGWMLECK